MTVSIQTPVNDYIANGSVTTFPYSFYVGSNSQLAVYNDGVQVITGFTVSGVGNPSGGNVVFTSAPANGVVVRIRRVMVLDRQVDYTEGAAFSSTTVDADIDNTVIQLQNLDSLAVKRNYGDDNLSMGGDRITDVGSPVNANDVVTKTWAETAGSSFVTQSGISATNAANSATAAAVSASSASSSASAASTSATNAATSATTASTQATNASNSATTASTQAANAASSAAAAAASYDAFDDRYLGSKSSDPVLDNDGNALLTGALYFNTSVNEMRVYTGSVWTNAANSVTAAAASASAAATSETNAASSATAASTSATNSANSATAASTSASNASSSATSASSSASSASTSATNAANSATTASTQATNAANSATAANTSATSASSSSSSASTSATTASTQATNAASSASSASTSASAASTSATNAASSATTASTQATNAASSASAAATSATNAASSASLAAFYTTLSATNASDADASATAADTSANNAASSATAASTSASSAATSATNAASSASSAAASYDAFDDRYLGSKSANPTVDNDGNALLTGALYFNTSVNEMRVWSGSSWNAAYLPAGAYVQKSGDTMTGTLITTGLVCAATIKTSNYTATANDYYIFCNTAGGSFTLTLPSATTNTGRTYVVFITGASTVSITVNGSENLFVGTSGATTQTGSTGSKLTWVSDGTNWRTGSGPSAG